jgi:hypothetical protein
LLTTIAAPRYPLDDVEHDVALAGDGEILLHEIAETDVAVGLLDAAPQAGIDLHDTGDVIAA